MTFSVLTFDHKTGIYAGAATTGSLCVGGWVLRGDIESGLAASQGTAPSTFWRDGALREMFNNKSSKETIANLTAEDLGRNKRQLSVIDKTGTPFAYTGEDSIPFSGHLVGKNFVIAGNMLSSASVLDAMSACIDKTYNSEAEKILAILKAGQGAGGDKRGIQSAAMIILDPQKPPLDLRIDHHDNPIIALEELWEKSQRPPYSSWLDEVPVLNDRNRNNSPHKNTGS